MAAFASVLRGFQTVYMEEDGIVQFRQFLFSLVVAFDATVALRSL